jgi:sporulation integral membrane protein YtvI
MPEALKKILFNIFRLLLITLGIWILLKIGGYFVPFIIAFIFSSLIEPVVGFIETKLRINRKIGSVLSMLVVLGVIFTILGLLISRLVIEIINFYNSLNITFEGITAFMDELIGRINDLFIKLPPEITEYINTDITKFSGSLASFLKPIVDIAQGTIKFAFSLPQVIIFFIVTVLATYFMSSDKGNITKFLDSQIPANWLKNTRRVLNNIFSALLGWLRTQFILVLVAVGEACLGFLIMGIRFPLLLVLLIAVTEFIPGIRADMVLIPLGIINLIAGNTRLGLSLIILDVIIMIVRQLLEPKILGKQMGIHPLLTLLGIYVGLRVLGIVGLLLGPLCVMIIKCILEGILKTDGLKGWINRNFRMNPGSAEENPVAGPDAFPDPGSAASREPDSAHVSGFDSGSGDASGYEPEPVSAPGTGRAPRKRRASGTGGVLRMSRASGEGRASGSSRVSGGSSASE